MAALGVSAAVESSAESPSDGQVRVVSWFFPSSKPRLIFTVAALSAASLLTSGFLAGLVGQGDHVLAETPRVAPTAKPTAVLSDDRPYPGAALTVRDQARYEEDVVWVQQRLAKLGYQVEVDGYYGPMTQQAVKQFQDNVGLRADGAVENKT